MSAAGTNYQESKAIWDQYSKIFGETLQDAHPSHPSPQLDIDHIWEAVKDIARGS